jgi:Ca-activated chloride channel family protein
MGHFGQAAVALAFAAALLPAWQQQQEPLFRVDVKLVRMLATVKDKFGRAVGGLTKEDFTVLDNGVPQQIALFERHTEQPLSVAILLDISGSTAKEMKYQTDAVTRFVRALFSEGNPEDTAALFAFNWEVSRPVNFTRNPARFAEAMKRLRAEAGTSLYDAILLASEDIADREGRHVVVVVTDGADTVSASNYQRAMRAAHAADVVLYPILTIPIANEAGRNVGGENALTTMSQSTGGRMFMPGANGLDAAFHDIIRDLRTQYLIGYYPRGLAAVKDPFHRIQLRLKNPELNVQTRTGYYEDSGSPAGSPR